MKKILSIFIVCLIVVMTVAGCTKAQTGTMPATDTSYNSAGKTSESAVAPSTSSSDGSASGSGLTAGEIASQEEQTNNFGGRKVIQTTAFSVETSDFDANMTFLRQKVAEYEGYVESSVINGRAPTEYGDTGRTAQMALRIPADKLDAFVTDAKTIGTLLSYNESAEDITSEYYDIETRLDVLNTQLTRLKSILVNTNNLADVLALEKEIADVTLQIEQLTSERKRYDGLVDFATVNITLNELALKDGAASDASIWDRMSKGFVSTLYGVGVFFEGLLVFLVAASPALVLIGIITVGIIFWVRHARKKKRARAVNGIPQFPQNWQEPDKK